jgi:hypothetical protein
MRKNFKASYVVFIFALLWLPGTGVGQVLNDHINYLLQFRQAGNWGVGPFGHTLNFYGTNDTDNEPTYTRPFSTLCYYTSSVIGGVFPINVIQEDSQGVNKNHDLSIHGFLKASISNPCTYNNTVNPKDISMFEKAYLLTDPRLVPKTTLNYTPITLTLIGAGTASFREYWRFAYGNSLARPLRFGMLNSTDTAKHQNNNYAAPDATTTNYGYTNTYGTAANPAFTNEPDVAYTFELNGTTTINITTLSSITDFDTRIHLVRITGTGANSYQLLKTNDNLSAGEKRSTIADTLCAGTYGIIVEGNTGERGNFALTINTQALSAQTSGSITSGFVIPKPQELSPIVLNNVTAPLFFPSRFTPVLSWEKSENNGNTWQPAINSKDSVGYVLPTLNTSTLFRRVYNVCGTRFLSNEAAINVVNPNGAISGKVKSLSGAGVKGVAILVYKNGVSLTGSANNFTYTDTTDDQGNYAVQRIYYGNPNDNATTPFVVKPLRQNHVFDNDSIVVTLTNIIPQLTGKDFVDSTVYSLSGQVTQQCTDCNGVTGVQETQTCPVDSVSIGSNVAGVIPVLTGYNESLQQYGRFALSVQNPGAYNIIPTYRNHLFLPPVRSLVVNGDINNVNFTDTSTHVISGRLMAGCNDYIGTAVLEFSDVLNNDINGNPRSSCFRKRITTAAGSGAYSIRLPARKYKVRIVSFSATADVSSPDLLAFFETAISADSLVRDITEKDATLMLTYQRPPTMVLEGLNNDCNRIPADSAFVVIPQNVTRTFLVKLYQGPAAKGCPVADTTLLINTNVQLDDNSESISRKTTGGIDTVRLKGGTPNIVYPFYKPLNIQFTDIFGRTVQQNRNVVVTGLKANIGSFATVSPELPLMVLHDPPGDNSFSFWETSRTNEIAMRIFGALNNNTGSWGEIKIGTTLITGLGVATETSVWGTIRGSVDVLSRASTDAETIISTTTTQNFSTAENSNITGDGGDVFIGAALNLKYAITNEVSFTPPCGLSLQKRLMVANDGFATEYIYSENHIRNTLLPTLVMFRDNPINTPAQTTQYSNQINVWQQVLANNEANKNRAAFDKNISFDGSSGPITSTTTTSSTRNNTVEFNLEIDAQLALELGFEAAGSGLSGGVNVGFKVEMGNSRTNTVTNSTTFGYTLDDDDDGDFFSVDIKKDPVYNTPVFALAAGTSSCPNEQGTQPRDEMQLVAPVPVVNGIAPDGEAEFVLQLSNTSQSGEQRTYELSFVQASNPNGAVVTIGGSPAVVPITYTIGYLGQVQVVVKVKRGASNVFSYEGLQFKLTDACGGDIEKTAALSVFFSSTCSNIQLAEPANNWVNSSKDNNLLPILFKGYNLNNLTSVTLEYAKAGQSNWVAGFTQTAAQINNSSNGTLVNWNIANVPDGSYSLRMKLNCATGVVYSERATGIIDRKPPQLLGKQQPTDDVYVNGDVIGIDFTEDIDCSTITNYNVLLKRVRDSSTVPARLGCYQNSLVVAPLTPIVALFGDTLQVTVRDITDLYGNTLTTPPQWAFAVGSAAPIGNAAIVKLSSTNTQILENSNDSISYIFQLPANAANDMKINFTVSGNSTFTEDYTVKFDGATHPANSFTGAQGSIVIKQGRRNALLKLIPVKDTLFSPNKIITLQLAEGGDYLIGSDSTLATGTILNDDTQDVYTFTGNGVFTDASNWSNSNPPPYPFPLSDEIIINPSGNGECILNVRLRVREGGKFTVMPGKKLVIQGNVRTAQ